MALFPLSAARQGGWRLGVTCGLAIWLNWWLHVAVDARWSFWLLLLGQFAVLGWLARPQRTAPPVSVPKATRARQPVTAAR